jgi:hypothetical protein
MLIDRRHVLSFLVTNHPVTQAMFDNPMIDGAICRLLPARCRPSISLGARAAAVQTAPMLLTKITSSPASLHVDSAASSMRFSSAKVRDLSATGVKIQGLPVSMAVTPN